MKKIHKDTFHVLLLLCSFGAIATNYMGPTTMRLVCQFICYYGVSFAVGGLYYSGSHTPNWKHIALIPFLLLIATGIVLQYNYWVHGIAFIVAGLMGAAPLVIIDFVMTKRRTTARS